MPDFDAQTVRYDEPDTFLPLDAQEVEEAQQSATDDYVTRWASAQAASNEALNRGADRSES